MDDLVIYFSVFYDINFHSLNFTSVILLKEYSNHYQLRLNISHFFNCYLLLNLCHIATLVVTGSANFM